MEYGIRTRELSCSGTEAASIPPPGYPSAWLESMALAAYGNPLAYHHHHHQLPLFLNSLQQSLQANYENAALELVHKPKKHEPPDDEEHEGKDEEEEEDEDRPSDELENEASEADSWKEAQMPVLSSWMLNAYTTMLSRLSAFSAAYEAAESSNLATDSESESDHSSYTRSRDSSPANSERPTYIISDKTTTTTTRKKKRKPSSKPRTTNNNNTKESASSESGSTTSQGKKRSLALQRVRYRYEREEYRCSLCSYACTIEKAFQRHLRAHARGTATETRVSCAVCGADRSSEVDLSKHMRRHRDNRFFCCDICIFRTVQLKKLIQHRRMHTGEKPHLCPHCSYRSARRDNLRSHVRRVHKKENLYCDTFSPRGMLLTPKLQPPSPSPEDDVHDDDDEVEDDKVSVSSPAQPPQEPSADLEQ